jgi:hypothetical protein
MKLFNDIWNGITSTFSSDSDTSSHNTQDFASAGIGSSESHDEGGSSFSDPTPFNGFGTSACDIQCWAESCSTTSFSNDNWGSTASSSGSGTGSDW